MGTSGVDGVSTARRRGGRSSEFPHARAALSNAFEAVKQLEKAEGNRSEREDLLRFQLGEIDDVDPRSGELEQLEGELSRLSHAEHLASSASQAEDQLYGMDEALTARLGRIAGELATASALDASLQPLVTQLDEAKNLLEDAAQELGRYGRGVVVDPDRMTVVSERIDALKQLRRKYGSKAGEPSLEAVTTYRAQAAAELEALSQSESALAGAQERVRHAREEAGTKALALSKARQKSAITLGKAISSELASLAMGDARVEVQVSPIDGATEEFFVDGARLTNRGIDHVEFLIAPNPGEEARPLGKVASGGELSRSLLAIKRVLAGLRPTGLYVFDEVDAGVGGAIAEVIGRKLHDVAQHHQVLCITHLPQIAAFADQHFRVSKDVIEGRTRSAVEPLDERGRLNEVARMLGGLHVSEKTKAAAQELIEAARGASWQAAAQRAPDATLPASRSSRRPRAPAR